LFLVISGVVFLGFVLNSLFYKIKISSILPLLIIGLVIGPVLGVINTAPGSTIAQLSPYVSAIALAFILFDVGLSINSSSIGEAATKAAKFTTVLSSITGLVLSGVVYILDGHNAIFALICGFALSGPSSIVISSITKFSKLNDKLTAVLVFESVMSDIFSLVIPILLLSVVVQASLSYGNMASVIIKTVIGAIGIGISSAFFWIFILKNFKTYSRDYSWMLTLTTVIATYGIAQYMNTNGAIAVFVFGIFLINIPDFSPIMKEYTLPIKEDLLHIRSYQKEITFFISTFFFVYIGLLFNIGQVSITLAAEAMGLSIIIFVLRVLAMPMLNTVFLSKDKGSSEHIFAYFDVARGLSPAIIAAMPMVLGINIPWLLDVVFLVIFFTNVLTTLGMYLYAGKYEAEKGVSAKSSYTYVQQIGKG